MPAAPQTSKPDSPAFEDPRRGYLALGVFLVLYALAYLDRHVLNLMVEPIRRDLGATDFQISLLQGIAFVAFFSLSGLPLGWAVDRYPRRIVVFCGIIFWSVAAAAGAFATRYWHLLLARFGVGAGEAALAPAAYSILADLFPPARLGFAMAIFSSGAIVGGAISLAAGGLIVGLASEGAVYVVPFLGEFSAWQLVFLVTGAPGLLLVFLIFLVSEPKRRATALTDRTAGPNLFEGLRFMASQRGFFSAHLAGFSLLNLVAYSWIAWSPTFLARTLGWSIPKVGLILGAATLIGGLVGMLGSGRLADHLFRRGVADAHLRIYVYAALGLGALIVTAGLVPQTTVVVVCVVLASVITPFIAVAATALQITTPARYRGQVSAVFLLVYNIVGAGLGPVIVAAFTDYVFAEDARIGWSLAASAAIFTPLASLCFARGLAPMRRALGCAGA